MCGRTSESQSAAIQSLHHAAWTSDNGIGAVFNIQQASDGFLWLTTSRGVLRFDGVRFESLEQATFGAVQDVDTLSVFVSPSGSLWLTTRSAGILRWKDGKITVFSDRRCTPAGLIGGMVAEEGDESLWFASTSGLAHLNGSACELIGTDHGYPGGFPKSLFVDRSRTVWVVSASGILLSKPQGQRDFRSVSGSIHSSGTAVVIRQDPTGTIWISDDAGLRHLITGDKPAVDFHVPVTVAPPSSRDFAFAANGSLWTVSSDGVDHFSQESVAKASPYLDGKSSESFTPQQGLSSDGVSKVMIDREGTVWIGTNSGLDSLHRPVLQSLSLPHTQEHELGLVAAENGSLWVGSRSMPLTHVMPDGTVKTLPEMTQLTCIRRDRSGAIWLGRGVDSSVWRSEGDRFVRVPGPVGDNQPVVALEFDRNNVPWIYTTNGLTYRMLHYSWVNENEELGKKIAVLGAMTSDEAGNIWFAFSDRLVKWDGDKFEKFSYPKGMQNVSPATMSAHNGHVWLAGRGGVDLFSNGRFYQMRWKDKNPVGRVSGIAETPDGELWINGFSGITHISAPALTNWLRSPTSEAATEHFDTADGLPGFSGDRLPEPSLVQAPDGKLWFATTKGVASLNPSALASQRNQMPPPVVITSITGNGKAFPGWNDIVFPQHTRNLEVDYTALSLFIPQRVLFRYKLEGYDKDWQDAGTRRQVFYTGLPPRHYRMRVIACNNDGIWNDIGAGLNVTLQPAFYQTIWFLALCGVLLLIATWRAYLFRVERLADALRARFNERLNERTRLAHDLHDTLLQTIQAGKLSTDQALARSADIVGLRNALERLSELLGQAVAEGRAALSALHVSSTESNDLARALRGVLDECLNCETMQVDLSIEGKSRDMHPIARDEVYRIAYEAIRNACAHSEATLLKVQLVYTHELTLRVLDNGKGIDPYILRHGRDGHYGLSGLRERATRIGAILDVSSSQPGGTRIVLTVAGKAIFLNKRS
ncbi:signal transduction histidine kinase/streptogramin lyase [Granulicella aggregans]|uniref:Signal transduction histidine kinase/streptogramin lyase n=1 Tax=Granulicella aggregans TaxID=474949 RepID=A0A7W7ZH91_9BACT|nr:signal transduction histidine kinase/streptogramin lyase [Granulicella aggregans]